MGVHKKKLSMAGMCTFLERNTLSSIHVLTQANIEVIIDL